jgi:cyclase
MKGGRHDKGIDAVDWAARGEALGAGEILLTSMDTDGVQTGFDCDLTRAVSRATHIPVIASGGAGAPEHFLDVLTAGFADAALTASIFPYGTYDVMRLKELGVHAALGMAIYRRRVALADLVRLNS